MECADPEAAEQDRGPVRVPAQPGPEASAPASGGPGARIPAQPSGTPDPAVGRPA